MLKKYKIIFIIISLGINSLLFAVRPDYNQDGLEYEHSEISKLLKNKFGDFMFREIINYVKSEYKIRGELQFRYKRSDDGADYWYADPCKKLVYIAPRLVVSIEDEDREIRRMLTEKGIDVADLMNRMQLQDNNIRFRKALPEEDGPWCEDDRNLIIISTSLIEEGSASELVYFIGHECAHLSGLDKSFKLLKKNNAFFKKICLKIHDSYERELNADRESIIRLGCCSGAITATERLIQENKKKLAENPEEFYYIKPDGDIKQGMIKTHPSYHKRLAYFKKLQQELGL